MYTGEKNILMRVFWSFHLQIDYFIGCFLCVLRNGNTNTPLGFYSYSKPVCTVWACYLIRFHPHRIHIAHTNCVRSFCHFGLNCASTTEQCLVRELFFCNMPRNAMCVIHKRCILCISSLILSFQLCSISNHTNRNKKL